MKKTMPRGFTLIELMIVLAIAAILTAIAMPSYTAYIQRANRAHAKAALLKAAQWMERVATAQGTYPTPAMFATTGLNVVEGNRYTVGLTVAPPAAPTTFVLTATPTPNGGNATDKCGNFTIDQAGTRTISGTLNVTDCWSR